MKRLIDWILLSWLGLLMSGPLAVRGAIMGMVVGFVVGLVVGLSL